MNTHYGFVSGVKYFYEIKNGHVYYKGKLWNHASTMNFYKIKDGEKK